MFDKEFILELEKNLGLREATANLMPPSPAPSTDHTSRPMATLEPNVPGSIPALRPPPQSMHRHSGRRNTTSVSSSTLAEASLVYQQRRDTSLPRFQCCKTFYSSLMMSTNKLECLCNFFLVSPIFLSKVSAYQTVTLYG
jgi:hypothetical protein